MFAGRKEENNPEEGQDKKKVFLRKASVFVVSYFDALVALMVLVIFVVGFFFLINPKYKSIKEAEQYSLEDLISGKSKLEDYLSKLTEYRNLYRDLSSISRERIEKTVPQDDHLENFFAQIENITKKQGIIISSLSVTEVEIADKKTAAATTAGEILSKANINLLVSGVDYAGVKKLLTIFENNLRIMDVESVKFDTESKTAEFAIIAYFLK